MAKGAGVNINFPEKFKDYLLEVAGDSLTPIILDALKNTQPITSIRLNPFKPLHPQTDSVVNMALSQGDPVPWCKQGYYLKERPNFTMDPSFHAGAYYVQEPSSMFLALLEPLFTEMRSRYGRSLNVLDLCAAPGGKSTHLISVLPPDTSIVVNEVIKSRLSVLKENILKWGRHDITLTNLRAGDFSDAENLFDFVLIDAPCSGEGMFRKDPAAIAHWSEESVKMCAERQREILAGIRNSLAPGGFLAYSTCTFNNYENDMNVAWIKSEFKAEVVSLEDFYHSLGLEQELNSDILAEWGVLKSDEGGYRFYPGVARGEGFYFALLRMPAETNNADFLRKGCGSSINNKKTEEEIDEESVMTTTLLKDNQEIRYKDNLSNSYKDKQSIDLKDYNSNSYKDNNQGISLEDKQSISHNFKNRPKFRNLLDSQNASSNHVSKSDSHKRVDSLSKRDFGTSKHKGTEALSKKGFGTGFLKNSGAMDKSTDAINKRDFVNSLHESAGSISKKDVNSGGLSVQPLHSQSLRIQRQESDIQYPQWELTKEKALKYLSRQTIKLDGAPLGYLLVTYGGLGLGFVKNIGTRANNLYPLNWRISAPVLCNNL